MNSPLKWHGGKHYLAKWILGLAPPRCKNPNKPAPDDAGYVHYVEPFAGGLSVLLENDPDGISECVADKSGRLVNFWQVLSHEFLFAGLQRHIAATPFSEQVWQTCRELAALPIRGDTPNEGRILRAWAFFVLCRQSLSGRMKSFTGVTKTRARRGMNNEVSAWLSAIEGLPDVAARLSRVLILHRNALETIKTQDGPRTWFYLDPPYLGSTRAAPDVYECEMTEDEHRELLDVLGGIKGRFALSGYPSDLYATAAKIYGWNVQTFTIPNHAAGGGEKRMMTECLWRNYV